MASILKVDDLRGNTAAGNITVTDGGGNVTFSLTEGLTKSYIAYHTDSGTAQKSNDSLNVSSLSDQGTGQTNINFTNNHSHLHYASSDSGGDGASGYATWMSSNNGAGEHGTGYYRCGIGNNTFSSQDGDYHSMQTYGDLA
jgi:hypothetical protein